MSASTPTTPLPALPPRGQPFRKGNPGGPGNPYAGQVARIRAQLYKASTPERLEKLIEIAWKKALGEWEVECEVLSINPRTGRHYKDRRTEFKLVKEPPSPWHMTWLGERIFPKTPQGIYESDESGAQITDEDKLARFAATLEKYGIMDKLPSPLRLRPGVIVATQEPPPSAPPPPQAPAPARKRSRK